MRLRPYHYLIGLGFSILVIYGYYVIDTSEPTLLDGTAAEYPQTKPLTTFETQSQTTTGRLILFTQGNVKRIKSAWVTVNNTEYEMTLIFQEENLKTFQFEIPDICLAKIEYKFKVLLKKVVFFGNSELSTEQFARSVEFDYAPFWFHYPNSTQLVKYNLISTLSPTHTDVWINSSGRLKIMVCNYAKYKFPITEIKIAEESVSYSIDSFTDINGVDIDFNPNPLRPYELTCSNPIVINVSTTITTSNPQDVAVIRITHQDGNRQLHEYIVLKGRYVDVQ